ncbi:hypothetical protein [Flindersiella endophytica]
MTVLSLVLLAVALVLVGLAAWAASRTTSRRHGAGEIPAENELQHMLAEHEITADELRARSADALQVRERVPRLVP